jgi:hypothetical protein
MNEITFPANPTATQVELARARIVVQVSTMGRRV